MEKNQKEYPKILIISHNLFDVTNNIGKTLVSLLEGWPKERIAQIYLRNDQPSFDYCDNYYCITDKDVVKSIVTLGMKKAGKEVNKNKPLPVSKVENNFYRIGNHRKPIISIVRDFFWNAGTWKTKRLENWLKCVSPNIILFVPNDYCLAYKVCLYVEDKLKVPIIPFYMDDSFYYGQYLNFFDFLRRKKLRKNAKMVHKFCDRIFTICDSMSEEYYKKYKIPCYTFMNSVLINPFVNNVNTGKIKFSYIGNLHSNRWKSLIDIAECIEMIDNDAVISIYSASALDSKTKLLFNRYKCIEYKGAIPYNQVREKQIESDVLIHIEAFDKKSKLSTRLSLSTKIPEYLSSGRCVFAYGPESVASIRYLQDNAVAMVCTEKAMLKKSVLQIIKDKELRKNVGYRGYKLACDKHNINDVSNMFKKLIIDCDAEKVV